MKDFEEFYEEEIMGDPLNYGSCVEIWNAAFDLQQKKIDIAVEFAEALVNKYNFDFMRENLLVKNANLLLEKLK